MSFNQEIKEELMSHELNRAAKLIEAKGAAFAMNPTDSGFGFLTENRAVIDYMSSLFVSVYGRNSFKVLEVQKRSGVLYSFVTGTVYGRLDIDVSSDNDFGVFLRGVFLVCGFAADPEKRYQLEIFLHDREKCLALSRMLSEHGIPMRHSSRRGSSFLYVKDSELITDVLAYIGAAIKAMDIMNTKIYKEVRNNVNRTVNCEAANLDRTLAASEKQIEDINYIYETAGMLYLPEELREVAKIRVDSPESSLSDIGQMLSKPLSRSGVNHRLRRISALADALREKKKNGAK